MLRRLPVPIGYPGDLHLLMESSIGASSSVSIALTYGNKIATVFSAPRDMVVRNIGFQVGTLTAAGNCDCRIETVDTDGYPTGTLWASNTNATTYVDTSSTFYWSPNLTADASISAGDIFAIQLVPANDASNYQITRSRSPGFDPNLPYVLFDTSSFYTSVEAAMRVRTSDGNVPFLDGIGPGSTTSWYSSLTFRDGTNPDERGIRFKIPFVCQISGVNVRWNRVVGNTDDHLIRLYDDADRVIAQTSVPASIITTSTSATMSTFPLGPVRLVPNKLYRLTLFNPNTTNYTSLRYTLMGAAADGTYLAGGSEWYYTERNDGASWTDNDIWKPWISLLICALEDGRPPTDAYVSDPLVVL